MYPASHRFNTGNEIQSEKFEDASDNLKDLELFMLSADSTFSNRLGKSRLTLAGMASAASDPAVAIGAAQTAVTQAGIATAQADRAKTLSDNVEQNAVNIAASASSQVISGVSDALAQSEAVLAAVVAGAPLLYASIVEGRSATDAGGYFSVYDSAGIITTYKKLTASTHEKISDNKVTNDKLAPPEVINTHLDELKKMGLYAVLRENVTEALGFPITGHDLSVEVLTAGKYGVVQIVRSAVGGIASRAFRTRWSDWSFSLDSSRVPINRGSIDGVELLKVDQEGTYFAANALDFPAEFGRNSGFFSVEKFGLRYKRELIDQYDQSNRYIQMGGGSWEKVSSGGSGGGGATIDVDPSTLPTGIAQTDISSETDVFYNQLGSMAVRQKLFSAMYSESNAVIANGNMLSTVYAFFDALAADFPTSVSMSLLGTDVTGLEIREYVIKPQTINKMASAPASINQFPEIMMFSGQHGQEHTAVVNLMIFCDEMMRNPNSSDLYATLRTSAVLRIMPAMNPWGVKNLDRRNSNGVDLNRNFPAGWATASGDKGSAPLSEMESVILANWVTANKAKSICTINMHDHSDQALTWGTATQGWPEKILFKSFQKFGKWYFSNFDDPTPEHPVSWLGNPRDGYSDKYIGEDLGVPALLFECPFLNHPKLGESQIFTRLASRQILIEVLTIVMQKQFNDI